MDKLHKNILNCANDLQQVIQPNYEKREKHNKKKLNDAIENIALQRQKLEEASQEIDVKRVLGISESDVDCWTIKGIIENLKINNRRQNRHKYNHGNNFSGEQSFPLEDVEGAISMSQGDEAVSVTPIDYITRKIIGISSSYEIVKSLSLLENERSNLEQYQDSYDQQLEVNSFESTHSTKLNYQQNEIKRESINFLETFYQIDANKYQLTKKFDLTRNTNTIETKEIQKRIYREQVVSTLLKEKRMMNKQFVFHNQKTISQAQEDYLTSINQIYQVQSMLSANEYLKKNAFQYYQNQYLKDITLNSDIQDIPQSLNEALQRIQFSSMKIPAINYFSMHRFIQFQTPQYNQNTQKGFHNNFVDKIDVVKEMGEQLPQDIQQLISNSKQFSILNWMCKKKFARPIQKQSPQKNKQQKL